MRFWKYIAEDIKNLFSQEKSSSESDEKNNQGSETEAPKDESHDDAESKDKKQKESQKDGETSGEGQIDGEASKPQEENGDGTTSDKKQADELETDDENDLEKTGERINEDISINPSKEGEEKVPEEIIEETDSKKNGDVPQVPQEESVGKKSPDKGQIDETGAEEKREETEEEKSGDVPQVPQEESRGEESSDKDQIDETGAEEKKEETDEEKDGDAPQVPQEKSDSSDGKESSDKPQSGGIGTNGGNGVEEESEKKDGGFEATPIGGEPPKQSSKSSESAKDGAEFPSDSDGLNNDSNSASSTLPSKLGGDMPTEASKMPTSPVQTDESLLPSQDSKMPNIPKVEGSSIDKQSQKEVSETQPSQQKDGGDKDSESKDSEQDLDSQETDLSKKIGDKDQTSSTKSESDEATEQQVEETLKDDKKENKDPKTDAKTDHQESSGEKAAGEEEQQEQEAEADTELPSEEIDESEVDDSKGKSTKDQIKELKDLKDEIEEHREEIESHGKKDTESKKITGPKGVPEESHEEEYTLDDQSNKFLEQLSELPSFKDRGRGPGYSIDTKGYTHVPESVIRTLITKFLNQRFCKRDTDLNVRSNSLNETQGFLKWKVKDVIVHLETEQVTKVLRDKFGYDYANGKNENVPLSFYFDLSGSMSNYTNMLAVIAIELLKKGVKVLVGFNERVNVQIDKIDGSISVAEFANILSTAGYASWLKDGNKSKLKRNHRVSLKFIDRNIDNYLLEKKAEKCVAFSDFDALVELSNLSQRVQVYYFCFESDYSKADLGDFKGFIYPVQTIKDIESGLVKVNSKRFETLCYTEKPKRLQKKLGE